MSWGHSKILKKKRKKLPHCPLLRCSLLWWLRPPSIFLDDDLKFLSSLFKSSSLYAWAMTPPKVFLTPSLFQNAPPPFVLDDNTPRLLDDGVATPLEKSPSGKFLIAVSNKLTDRHTHS